MSTETGNPTVITTHPLYAAVSKEYLTDKQIIFDAEISAFFSDILVLLFLGVTQENKGNILC